MPPQRDDGFFPEELDPAGCKKLIDSSPGCVIIDVRTPGEYSAGHLEGARNVDFFCPDFREKIETQDRGRSYVVYCKKGRRGERTKDMMKGCGFFRVVNIRGGIEGWKEAGLPLEK
jgi:rhodanese-related sulfurtransferase